MSLFGGAGDDGKALRAAIRYIASLEARTAAQDRELIARRREVERLRQEVHRERELRASAERGCELANSEGVTSDDLRRKVLAEQALRARLAKMDMSAGARLRTLRSARSAGVSLDPEQQAELRALERQARVHGFP